MHSFDSWGKANFPLKALAWAIIIVMIIATYIIHGCFLVRASMEDRSDAK